MEALYRCRSVGKKQNHDTPRRRKKQQACSTHLNTTSAADTASVWLCDSSRIVRYAATAVVPWSSRRRNATYRDAPTDQWIAVLVHKFSLLSLLLLLLLTLLLLLLMLLLLLTAGRYVGPTAPCLWWAWSLSIYTRPAPRVTTAAISYRHAAALFRVIMPDEGFSDRHTEHRGR